MHLSVAVLVGGRVLQELRTRRLSQAHGGSLSALLGQVQVVQVGHGLLANSVEHRLVHVVALTLVFNQRVTLGHCTQTDTFLEVLHLVQVLGPALTDDREHHAAFNLTHALFADALLTLVVHDVSVRKDFLHDLVAGNLGAIACVLS